MLKRIAISTLIALVLTVAVWATLVASYDEERGTQNVVAVSAEPTGSTDTDDRLAALSFNGQAESLSWASMDISVEVNGVFHSCGFGAQSLPSATDALVQPRLGADGHTFTTVVDATNEDAFTHVLIPAQTLGGEDEYTMRFSSTDVYLAEDVRWAFLEGVEFNEVTSSDNITFSNETTERLEWYEYDLTVHRITPIEGVYLFDVEGVTYKVQFVSYYNQNDERRYPTMLMAALDPTAFPALTNPDLVSPAPCLIVSGDDDLVTWNANETVLLYEHGTTIRSDEAPLTVRVRYEAVDVRIVEVLSTSAEE